MADDRDLHGRLLRWYARQRRELPWRQTRDPYAILVSEVMLQQTQADRVVGYYERFLARFPTPVALALADSDELHRLWKGLGYPSRADRLQAACREVVTQRDGRWPDTVDGLRELPGIGPYTAAAVACFAHHRAVPVIDTNVARVVCRVTGARGDRAAITAAAARLVPEDGRRAATWHNALMDLGATICTARVAKCSECPWATVCRARAIATPAARLKRLTATANPLGPTKKPPAFPPPPRRPDVHIVLALIHHDGKYLVAKRPTSADQGGTWEVPGGKREAGEDDRRAIAREVREELGVEVLSARHLIDWWHEYPGKLLAFHLYRCRVFQPETARPLASDGLRWVTPAEFVALQFPAANAVMIARMRRYHRLACG